MFLAVDITCSKAVSMNPTEYTCCLNSPSRYSCNSKYVGHTDIYIKFKCMIVKRTNYRNILYSTLVAAPASMQKFVDD